MAIVVGHTKLVMKAGEGRETVRRLGREQLFIFLARSRTLRARISQLRRSCTWLDKTAMLGRLGFSEI